MIDRQILLDSNITEEQRQEFIDKVNEITEPFKKFINDPDSITTRDINKLKVATTKVPELEKCYSEISKGSSVYDIELPQFIKLLTEENNKPTLDIKKVQEYSLHINRMISHPLEYENYNTDYIKAISEPIPEGIIFPYSEKGTRNEKDTIKLRSGLPTVIGAYSGVGKSSIMINLIYHYYIESLKESNSGKKINRQWVYSLEMTTADILIKLIQMKLSSENKTVPDVYETRKNYTNYIDFLKEIEDKIKIYSNDKKTEFISIDTIETQIDSAYLTNSLPDIVYIDYLQIISSKNNPTDMRLQIMDTMGRLTQLAKKYKFVLIVLAQANRTGSGKKEIYYEDPQKGKIEGYYKECPGMEKLQESSFIEQSAGVVLTLGRYIIMDKNFNDIIEISIEKNRFGISNHSYKYRIDKTSGFISKVVPESEVPKDKNSKDK